jgi:hypothetical protein
MDEKRGRPLVRRDPGSGGLGKIGEAWPSRIRSRVKGSNHDRPSLQRRIEAELRLTDLIERSRDNSDGMSTRQLNTSLSRKDPQISMSLSYNRS